MNKLSCIITDNFCVAKIYYYIYDFEQIETNTLISWNWNKYSDILTKWYAIYVFCYSVISLTGEIEVFVSGKMRMNISSCSYSY